MAKKRILTDEEKRIYDEAYTLANKLNGRLRNFKPDNEFREDYDRALKMAKAYKYLQPNGKQVRKSFKSMPVSYVNLVVIPALRKSLEDPKGNQRLLNPSREQLDKKRAKLLKDFKGTFGEDVTYKDVLTFFNLENLSMWRELTDNQVESETEFEVMYNATYSNFSYNGKTGIEAYLEEYTEKVHPSKQNIKHFIYEYFQQHPTIRGKYKYLNTVNG